MSPKNYFVPEWTDTPPTPGSYRSIAKFGDPTLYRHPGHAWIETFYEEFGMVQADFQKKLNEGNMPVRLDRPGKLHPEHIAALTALVGKDNVAEDDYSRVKYSSGKLIEESIELRQGIVREISDIVVHPRNKQDVAEIVKYCNAERIPVTVFSGGSSCNFGVRPVKGGVSLVMSTHMNKLLAINELNQTARVQPGMFGPAYEKALNEAPERFACRRRFTCGHFPQSFEYSTVGGWVVTLGSGQASTYYGDVYDIVFGQEYVTPTGNFQTLEFPATATGPKINDIMKGNEGTFGILVEVTMKIFRHMPESRQRFSLMFPNWEAAVQACREVMLGEFGMPAVFRISDAEETDRGLKHFGLSNFAAKYLALRGMVPMQRCICMGTVEGDSDYTKLVARKLKQVARRHGAISLGSSAVEKWEKTRYIEPYIREDLCEFGIMFDTLEAGVTWDNVHRLHQAVRTHIKSRPGTICMTHASHFYPQGTNLYFIFGGRMQLDEFRAFLASIVDVMVANGGSLSHHHGVGRMLAPWMEKTMGKEQMDVLRALKHHFDPNNIMNPGGQLGLDSK